MKNKTTIIAEAGVNHNGSLDTALELVAVAAKMGADVVKFQSFRAENVVRRSAPKADYQVAATGKSESQLEMLKKLELDEAAHHKLIERCRELKVDFLSTPFDVESVNLLAYKLGLSCLKISSGEITNSLLLLKAAYTQKKIILSTGMSTLEEVKVALGVLAFGYLSPKEDPSAKAFARAFENPEAREVLREKVTLLHCTTEYPAPFADVNLRAMQTMAQTFGVPVGLSDHTPGITVPIAAVALGATVIEKHFTLDKNQPGPDHKASLNPSELEQLVKAIRQVEAAMGDGVKVPSPSERKNLEIVRRSLVAARPVRKGQKFVEEDLTAKRPAQGVSAIHYWDWLGKTASRDFDADEPIGE